MRANAKGLDSLIESVADGGAIDWKAVEALVSDDRERRLIGHLRLVAGVADVHRTTPDHDEPSIPSTADVLPSGGAAPQWGHLLLVEKIGEGTFGEVYRARDPWLDREVALKLLKPGIGGDMPASRLLNEARTLASVRHENVVTVHGADLHDGRVGLWMEFVHGRTLSAMIAEQGPMSGAEAAVVGQELCRALGAVHAARLVHGDIKAQNVVRGPHGRLVLMDFGAGRFVDRQRPASLRASGTPLYLAPEVLDGGDVSVQSDIYALGVLLYFLVTGSYPVRASSLEGLAAAHRRGERRRLRDARPDLSDAFVAAVERAIDPEPNRRFATIGEMLPALTRVNGVRPSGRSATILSELKAARRKPIQLLATAALVLVIAAAAAYWRSSRPDLGVAYAAVQLVAVLPLQDLSGTEAYLAEGMTEALTQELSTSGPVKVASRMSLARLLAQNVTLPEIARTLDADAMIEGSLLRTGRDVRVNVRVVRAGSGAAVWARTFERTSADLASLQREIARAIASELQLVLHPHAVERWSQPARVDEVAYEAYLRGRHEMRQGTQAGAEAALEQFRRAIARDPKYAAPRAAMAEGYLRLGQDFAAMPQGEAATLAKASVAHALELDDRLAHAHRVLATIRHQLDWDFAGAEQQYNRAIELDPSFVEARLEYAIFLSSRARFDDAQRQLSLARELDPLSASVAETAGRVHYHARQYDRALAELRRAASLEPANVGLYVGLGRVLNAMGRHDEAIAEYTRAAASQEDHPYFDAEIAQADLAAGRLRDGQRRLARLRGRATSPGSQVTPYMLALVTARIDRDEAFTWLEREFEARSARVLALKVDPRVDPLRADPRFRALLQKLALEP